MFGMCMYFGLVGCGVVVVVFLLFLVVVVELY